MFCVCRRSTYYNDNYHNCNDGLEAWVTHCGPHYQVMDTPGVLSRPEEERNPMEGLTLAAVEHLPSAVVFVMDLSGTCGPQSAPLLQLDVRDTVRARYPDRPWIDVRSKADLPLAPEVPANAVPPGTLNVSVHEDIGVDELRRHMARLIGGEEEEDLFNT